MLFLNVKCWLLNYCNCLLNQGLKLIHDFLHLFQPRFTPPHRHRLCSLSLFLSLIVLQRESSPLWKSIARRRRDSPIEEKKHTDHFSIHIGALSQIYCNTVS
ncbi:unnamed protein product, partial [Brassica napus]